MHGKGIWIVHRSSFDQVCERAQFNVHEDRILVCVCGLCMPHHLCLLVSSLKCALSHKSFRSYAHTFSYSYSSHIRMMLSLMFASTADLFAKWFAPTTAKYETKLKSMRIYAIIMNCTYLSGKKASSFFAVCECWRKATSSIFKNAHWFW